MIKDNNYRVVEEKEEKCITGGGGARRIERQQHNGTEKAHLDDVICGQIHLK